MPSYHDIVEELRRILDEANIEGDFEPAREKDLAYLKAAGYPDSVIEFYRQAEPTEFIEMNEVRLYPVIDIREENEDILPGMVVAPFGYLNVGGTLSEDTYCLDMNTKNAQGENPIVLVSQDQISEGMSAEDAQSGIVRIADSFQEFLTRFMRQELPGEYDDAVESMK